MAKYLIAITSSRRAAEIRDLLGEGVWTAVRTHEPWTVFFHTDAAGDHLDGGLSLFKGWYVDHAREALVFGGAGAGARPSPDRPAEGCYIATSLAGDVLSIGNDLFGQLPLLHFREEDILVASDSLFALSEVRKAIGLPCRLEEEVARARVWTRGLGQQNQSDRTLIAGVRYAPVGSWLSVDLAGGTLQAALARHELPELFPAPGSSYRDAIRTVATQMGRQIASFASVASAVPCAVSGGQDSRAVFAAASLIAPAHGNVTAASSERSPGEFAVATSLAALAGLDLRPRPPGRPDEPGTSLSRWLLHSAGLYDKLSFAVDRDPADGVFPIGGHGGELGKGMWRWWRLPWLTFLAPPGSQAALRAECGRGLRAMGASPDQRWSAELHYLGYRNAIHGGRTSASYLFASSPLMLGALVGLAHSDRNRVRPARRGAPSIITDLTIVLRPDLAAHRYAESSANLPKHHIEARLRELGGPIDPGTLVPYAVTGNPRRAAIRSSPVFGERAARACEAADTGGAPATDLALAGIARCPPSALNLYQPMLRRLRAVPKAKALPRRENILAAKLIGLNLLD